MIVRCHFWELEDHYSFDGRAVLDAEYWLFEGARRKQYRRISEALPRSGYVFDLCRSVAAVTVPELTTGSR